MDFEMFPKISRLYRDIIVTEKLDGTNAQICVSDDGATMLTGSRNRWITPESDNAGFARWALEHRQELLRLGPGRHFGEWWGSGIQRRYGLTEKRFSLFNTLRWGEERPACCHVVPVLYRGPFDQGAISDTLDRLRDGGSIAAPGFMSPEGIVVFHTHSGQVFKVTLEGDQHKDSK
jgi:hypothetical protein